MVTFESSDEQIATVDETGKVNIKAAGEVVIIAKTGNDKKAYCSIEIEELSEESEIKNKVLADINGDSKIDTTDLLTVLRHMAATVSSDIAQKHQDWVLEGDKYLLADVNGNGIIDVTDSLKLQRHIAASKNETIRSKHADWIIQTNWE